MYQGQGHPQPRRTYGDYETAPVSITTTAPEERKANPFGYTGERGRLMSRESAEQYQDGSTPLRQLGPRPHFVDRRGSGQPREHIQEMPRGRRYEEASQDLTANVMYQGQGHPQPRRTYGDYETAPVSITTTAPEERKANPFGYTGERGRLMSRESAEQYQDGSTPLRQLGPRPRFVDRRGSGQPREHIQEMPRGRRYEEASQGLPSHSFDRRNTQNIATNVPKRHERNMHKISAFKLELGSQYRTVRPRARSIPAVERQGPALAHHLPKLNLAQDKDSLEICMKNLSYRRCMFGTNCRRHHCNERFQWQYKNVHKENDTWHNFNPKTNNVLERTYCQPDKENCPIKFWRSEEISVIFDERSMHGVGRNTRLEVRRLSTTSSEIFSGPLSVWTTVWKWYWEESDSGNWIEYGAQDQHGSKASFKSGIIEQHYQENPKATILFSTDNFDYTLNFDMMRQENDRMSTKRRVRRRPQFFEKEELKKRKYQARFTTRSQITVPKTWTAGNAMSEEELCNYYNLVEILPTSEEYEEIRDLFYKTMSSSKRIRGVERIENGELWISYKQKQLQMKRKSGGKDVNEMKLFHGTKPELIKPICREGFDFRFSGTQTGALYGRGSYFAKEAQYSDSYAKESSTSGTKKLFVNRVLVGEFAKGEKPHVRPPAGCGDNPHNLFDSCVDNVGDPKIFVIFTLEQVYPEYLITYK